MTVGDDAVDAADAEDVVLAETVAGALLDVEPQAASPECADAAQGHWAPCACRPRGEWGDDGHDDSWEDQRFGNT